MPLSDDEFNELLHRRLNSDDGDQETGEDLLSEEDEADLTIMREALGNYKAESLAWAERRSAAMPSPRPTAAASSWGRTSRWALAGTTLAAFFAGAATFSHFSRHVPVAVAAPSAQALAADNQLLSSVDAALAGGASAPTEQELGLSSNDLLTGVQDTQRHGGTKSATN